MVQLHAFGRSLHLAALVGCSVAMVALASPASARSHHHGAGRHAHAHHTHHRHHGYRHHHRRFAQAGDASERSRAQIRADASVSPAAGFGGSSSSNVVAEARRYIGSNPTGRGRLWCARFMNMVLQHSGLHGTGSDMARSFAGYGQRVSGPQVGAIAVAGVAAVMSAWSAASTPRAIRSWCPAITATESRNRSIRAAASTRM
jgi:hypothetical protein